MLFGLQIESSRPNKNGSKEFINKHEASEPSDRRSGFN